MSGVRRRSREAALQMLYQLDGQLVSVDSVVAAYWASLASSHDGVEFADELVRGFCSRSEEVDEVIRGASQHWRLERMNKVDRNVLRLGTYELLHVADVPKRVTLNEAVELAKRFGTETSAAFVNGILDRIATPLVKE